MHIMNPVTAYIAANNMEAHAVQMILEDAGIKSQVVEDNCQTEFGFSPMIHQPKILVDVTQLEQSKLILLHYEEKIRRRKEAEEKLAKNHKFEQAECMHLTCEHCQHNLTFPIALEGTIQTCPSCKQSIDVEIHQNN